MHSEQLEKIEKRLEALERVCSRMDNHISFVEHQYRRLRGPLDWLVSSFSTPLSYFSRAKALVI